jgi:hypothetical protein
MIIYSHIYQKKFYIDPDADFWALMVFLEPGVQRSSTKKKG